jgi:hypothetical protein
MSDRKLHPNEVRCAQRLNGHEYQRLHREFNFTDVLKTFRQSGNWNHLSTIEAMATLSLLEKALQLWTHSKSIAPEHLDQHFDAFHSLYAHLKVVEDLSDE